MILDIIKEKAAVGKCQWEIVNNLHVKNGYPDRGGENLKKRYNELVGRAQRMPTGDPDIPDILRRAREVSYNYRSKIGVVDPSREAQIEGEALEITAGATAVRAGQIRAGLKKGRRRGR